MLRFAKWTTPVWFLILTGCAVPPDGDSNPARPPLQVELPSFEAPSEPDTEETPSRDRIREPEGPLTLRLALALALMQNPRLGTSAWDVRIREAEILQAGLLPNPELDVSVEEVGGRGARSGFKAAETSLSLSQLVELGGKRSARVRLAETERHAADWEYETQRLAVLAETALAFIDVLAAQERLRLAGESDRLSEEVLRTVAERVKAGKVSPLEESKASIERSQGRIGLAKAGFALEASRARLATRWGAEAPRFDKAVGGLALPDTIPTFASLRRHLARNPEIARWTAELQRRRSLLELERARGMPDVTLIGGVQRFEESDDFAFLFGFSVPLPLFDRQQGGVRAAQFRVSQTAEERLAATMRVHAALVDGYESLAVSHREVATLEQESLPTAWKAFQAAREGYRQGKFGYLEVLDAQRTLFEIRERHLEALTATRKALSLLEGLIGTPLEALDGDPEKEQQP